MLNRPIFNASVGVQKARTFRRLPEPDRWTLEDWDELKGLPWLWKPSRTKMPGSSPIPISDAPLPVQAAGEKEPPKPRRLHIRKPLLGWRLVLRRVTKVKACCNLFTTACKCDLCGM